jgi:hypothetical protein
LGDELPQRGRGAERFLVEFIRRNDAVLAGLTQPRLFAGALIAVGVALLLTPPSVLRTSPSGAAGNYGLAVPRPVRD